MPAGQTVFEVLHKNVAVWKLQKNSRVYKFSLDFCGVVALASLVHCTFVRDLNC